MAGHGSTMYTPSCIAINALRLFDVRFGIGVTYAEYIGGAYDFNTSFSRRPY
jgi:hypothetical protein